MNNKECNFKYNKYSNKEELKNIKNFKNPTNKNINLELIKYRMKLNYLKGSKNFKSDQKDYSEFKITNTPRIKQSNPKLFLNNFYNKNHLKDNIKNIFDKFNIKKEMIKNKSENNLMYKIPNINKEKTISDNKKNNKFLTHCSSLIEIKENNNKEFENNNYYYKLMQMENEKINFNNKLLANTQRNKILNFDLINHNSKSSNKLSFIEFSTNNINKNTIQEIINKKNKENNDYIENLINQNKKNSHSQFNPSSNFLDGKINKEIPIVIPSLFTFSKKFNSSSECQRYEKNTKALLRLIYFLKNYPDKKFELINEFFVKYKFPFELYNEDKIENFYNFINYNFDKIDFTKIMKDIIIDGINFNYNEKLQCNNNNNKDSFKDLNPNYHFKINNNFSNMYRTFMNKKYKNINKNNIFFNHEIGKIDFFEKNNNLCNSLNKQKELNNTNNITSNKNNNTSLNFYNNLKINNLENEIHKINELHIGNNIIDQRNKRLYYEQKLKKENKNPEELLKKNKKLLEYIILQKAKSKLELEKDLLLDSCNSN